LKRHKDVAMAVCMEQVETVSLSTVDDDDHGGTGMTKLTSPDGFPLKLPVCSLLV
jgi:hypothetical protein